MEILLTPDHFANWDASFYLILKTEVDLINMPCVRLEKWNSENLRNLLWVAQLVDGGAEIQIQEDWL